MPAEAVGDEFAIVDPAAYRPGVDVEEIRDLCDRVKLLGGRCVDGAHALTFLL